MWYIIVIFILFIIVLHLLIYFYPKSITNYIIENKIKTLTLDELLNKVDNGDIILLSGNEFGEKSIRFYTQSYFSHIGIIIKDLDSNKSLTEIPYLWESDIGQGYKQGPRVIKLKDKLSRWKGFKHGVWKPLLKNDSNGGSPSKEELLSVVAKYVNMEMDENMLCWLFSSFPNSYIFKTLKNKNKIFCSELVASTLQDLGIMNKEKNPAYYTPQHFFIDKTPLTNFIYGEPQYFSF